MRSPEGSVNENKQNPILLEKMEKKIKEKKFDIDTIFDHTFKPGQKVKMGKKEKKTVKERLGWSFKTKEEGRISSTYYKILHFG